MLRPEPSTDIPELTQQIARAAVPNAIRWSNEARNAANHCSKPLDPIRNSLVKVPRDVELPLDDSRLVKIKDNS